MTEDVSTDAEDEERGWNLSFFSQVKAFFGKTVNVDKVMKTNPDVAKALKNPQVSKSFTELQKEPGLLQHFRNFPVGKLTARLRGKSTSLSKKNVETVGEIAFKSSGTWRSKFGHLWVKHGAWFLFAIGILFLFTTVYIGVT